jgi:hypothetical protein
LYSQFQNQTFGAFWLAKLQLAIAEMRTFLIERQRMAMLPVASNFKMAAGIRESRYDEK